MPGALLDTSVLLGGARGGLPESAAISVITLGELRAGILLARDDETRARRASAFAAVRSTFLALEVDERVADRYGEVLAAARRERRTAKATDLLIIATALAHDRTLHTRDDRQARLAQAVGAHIG